MLTTVEFGKPCDKALSLAVGYFDGVHLGHRTLLAEITRLSAAHGTAPAVSTFADSPKNGENIYGYDERRRLLSDCGMEICLSLYYLRVCGMRGEEFFALLTDLYDVRDIVCGENYTFGSDRCDVGKLGELCRAKGISLTVMPLYDYCGVRVSSTAVKTFLRTGDVDAAKKLLGMPYHIRGTVESGDGRGHRIGMPTVNIGRPADMMEIRRGVYGTYTELYGKMYRSVTNYGARPTFDRSAFSIETNLMGYEGGSLLGKEITVYFHRYLRPVRKFADAKELVETINRDKEWKDL